MADFYWTGGTSDGDFDTGGNWDAGSAPNGSDNIFFTNGITKSVTDGLDQSAVNTNVYFIRDFPASIGTPDNPLLLGSSITIWMQTLNCKQFNVSGSITKAVIENTSNNPYAFFLYGGTTTDLGVKKGRVRVGAGATVNTLGLSGVLALATLVDGATVPTINLVAGSIFCESAFTTLNQTGGTFTHEGTGDGATVNVHGGTYVDRSKSTITTLNVLGGHYIVDDHRAITITNANLLGGKADFGPNVTFTNPPKIQGCVVSGITSSIDLHFGGI